MPQDKLYFNARISTEGAEAGSNPSHDATFFVNMPQPLLQRAEDWEVSIIRFTCSLHGLPALFVDHPVQAMAKPTDTSYVFTLSYGTSFVSKTVQWECPDPTLNQTIDGFSDPYWYCYSYLTMGVLINNALAEAMTDLIALEAALVGVPAPFFSYDETQAVWNLFTPIEFLDSNPTPVHIYQNEEAHFLLSGYPVVPTGVAGRDERIVILQQGDEIQHSIAMHEFVARAQLPGSLTSWSPVKRFVFTTSSMPVVSELTVPQTPYNPLAQAPRMTYSSQKIITDMTPVIVRGDELLNGYIDYSPTAQYRLTNMNSGNGLNTIDFSVNWEDPLGGLHLMQLRYGGNCSVKFYFERVK
jgi:hypothetical protein